MRDSYYKKMTEDELEDVLSLDLREIEKKEARAFLGVEPKRALELSIKESVVVFTIIHKDEIEGVFGLVLSDRCGIPWFLSTDKIKDFKLPFLRQSKQVVKALLEMAGGELINYVSVENEYSIKWLEWLGFTVDKSEECYFYDEEFPFYKFTMMKEV